MKFHLFYFVVFLVVVVFLAVVVFLVAEAFVAAGALFGTENYFCSSLIKFKKFVEFLKASVPLF